MCILHCMIIYYHVCIYSEGACIVVKDQLISGGFPQQLYNPQCFLQYEEPTLPTQWWNVSDRSNYTAMHVLQDSKGQMKHSCIHTVLGYITLVNE